VFEFNAGLVCRKMPLDFRPSAVSVFCPYGGFSPKKIEIGTTSIEALETQCAQFYFRDVEPSPVLWRVVNFQSFG
jgi:hypothetical protein